MNFDFEAEIHRILEENDEETLENIVSTINEEIATDEDRYTKKAKALLRAYLDGDVDGFCIALCGWTLESILKKSGAVEDYDHTFS